MSVLSLFLFKEPGVFHIFFEILALRSDIQNNCRGEAVPGRVKKQQSIGIKSLYSNTSDGFEYKKLHK